MPLCRNDVTGRYNGTEPSPKGNGICAHTEPLGDTRKGLDGQWWTVKETKNGVKRWVRQKKSGSPSPSKRIRSRSKKKSVGIRSRSKKKTSSSWKKRRSPIGCAAAENHRRSPGRISPPYGALRCAGQTLEGLDGRLWFSERHMRKGKPYYKWVQ